MRIKKAITELLIAQIISESAGMQPGFFLKLKNPRVHLSYILQMGVESCD